MFVPLQEGVNVGVINAAGWLVALGSLAITIGWLYKLTT
jgi:hypothetical protein